ncbi:hypothetical protein JIG36_06520 [Actinoplanes sp. LDG1-06]|uniref:Uncharacterized protein n=1 Tax=Paractinoplanes ovalisporus TaxID=2810368 RepID=A0ABS2A7H6_9ACTN|nr:hypothetical protein [Actinoplanes ovalisporus]MBM2615216.1 hypothetical protein [Actinoplanes ovalisporus]
MSAVRIGAGGGGSSRVRGAVGTGAGGAAASVTGAAGAAGPAGPGARPAGEDGPSPTALVTATRGGVVPAAAVLSDTSDPSPFTTPRYAPAAPTTVRVPNAVTARARRGRRAAGARVTSPTGMSKPKVPIPVEVTSGPPAGGSAGARPMS